MELKKVIEKYIFDCEAARLSATTICNYKNHLSMLPDVEIDDFSNADIADLKQSWYLRGLKESTVSQYLRSIRIFFDWCVEYKYIAETPCTPFAMRVNEIPKQPYEKILSKEDVEKLLVPKKPLMIRDRTFPRNYAIVVLLLTSSIRNSELRNLTLDDLDPSEGKITIHFGKGGKTRTVAYPQIAQDAISVYLKSGIRPIGLKSSDYLFGIGDTAAEWHQINRFNLSDIVNRYVKNATGNENIRTHALRHSSASLLCDSGDVSVRDIQELLGHTNLQTTEMYISRLRPNAHTNAAGGVFNKLASAI